MKHNKEPRYRPTQICPTILDKGTRTIQWRKKLPFQQMVKQLDMYMQKMNPEPWLVWFSGLSAGPRIQRSLLV